MTSKLFVTEDPKGSGEFEPEVVTIRVWREFAVTAVIECHPQSGAVINISARSPLALINPVDIEIDPWAGLVRIVSARFSGCAGPPVDFGPRGAFDDEPPF